MKNRLIQIYKVYCRELRIIFADAGMILFFLFLPLAYPIIYSLIYNPELVRDVDIVVVDNDHTSRSRELVRNLNASQYVNVIGYAADIPEARRAMNEHKVYGILEIPEGFEKKIGRKETAPAVMYSEMSLMLRYKSLLMACTDVALSMGAEIQAADLEDAVPSAASYVSSDMLPIEYVPMGNIESGFCSFVMPGVIVLIIHQCILLAVGMAGGARRENPYLIGYDPINDQPSALMTLIGRALAYITILIVPIIFIAHFVPMIFSFPMSGNTLQIFAFLLPLVLSAIALGFIVQTFMTQREEIIIVWVVTSVIFLFLSGLTWPRCAMTGFWRVLSDICPSTWGVEGFIQMNGNGATLAQVGYIYRNLWICTAVYGVIAYVLQRCVVQRQKPAYSSPEV